MQILLIFYTISVARAGAFVKGVGEISCVFVDKASDFCYNKTMDNQILNGSSQKEMGAGGIYVLYRNL